MRELLLFNRVARYRQDVTAARKIPHRNFPFDGGKSLDNLFNKSSAPPRRSSMWLDESTL
jgi:hypothetical protein